MKIIVNKNIPQHAINKLTEYGKVHLFETKGIVNKEISCHADIFMCKIDDKLVVAPNTPKDTMLFLQNEENFCLGEKNVSNLKNNINFYNAVVTSNYLIHKRNFTDSKILEYCFDKDFINVKQAFTRCSLIELNDNYFITSDNGIANTLKQKKLDVLYVSQQDIILPGYNPGCFGGCCGVFENKFFVIGNLEYHKDGNIISEYIKRHNMELIQLYDGPLFDAGSIFFI
jgi:hypothetical protein